MGPLPRVAGLTRERIAREFECRGHDVCRAEITLDLLANNPELLDVATRRARAGGDFAAVMTGFSMFYQLLAAAAYAALDTPSEPAGSPRSSLLPRVSPATRALVVKRIDAIGSHEFMRETIAELERNNPELLLMSHHFAEDRADYGEVMQGFAFLYACLSAQARAGSSRQGMKWGRRMLRKPAAAGARFERSARTDRPGD